MLCGRSHNAGQYKAIGSLLNALRIAGGLSPEAIRLAMVYEGEFAVRRLPNTVAQCGYDLTLMPLVRDRLSMN